MEPLLIDVCFPRLRNDMTIAQAQIENTGQLPPTEVLGREVVLDMTMTLVRFLMNDHRMAQASQVADRLVFAEEADEMPTLYIAWLWLVRMSLFLEQEQYTLTLGCAENVLTHLATVAGKKSDDFLALVASTLYNLALTHHATRAAEQPRNSRMPRNFLSAWPRRTNSGSRPCSSMPCKPRPKSYNRAPSR